MHRWNFVLENDQFIACRKPSTITTIAHGAEEGKVWWHVAEIWLDYPRLGLKNVVVMSLHLNNIIAKKTVAGPQCLARAIDLALQKIGQAGRPSIDLICGDINGASTSDTALNALESRRLIPVALWAGECCLIGLRETLAQQLMVRGSCWGERGEDMTEEDRDAFHKKFLTRCGVKRLTSQDVHWPVQLHLRVMPGPGTRASGARSRTNAALHKRNAKKALRGYGPYPAQGAKGGKQQGGEQQGGKGGKQQGGKQQEQQPSFGRSSGYTAQHRQQPWWRSGSWGSWDAWWEAEESRH